MLNFVVLRLTDFSSSFKPVFPGPNSLSVLGCPATRLRGRARTLPSSVDGSLHSISVVVSAEVSLFLVIFNLLSDLLSHVDHCKIYAPLILILFVFINICLPSRSTPPGRRNIADSTCDTRICDIAASVYSLPLAWKSKWNCLQFRICIGWSPCEISWLWKIANLAKWVFLCYESCSELQAYDSMLIWYGGHCATLVVIAESRQLQIVHLEYVVLFIITAL